VRRGGEGNSSSFMSDIQRLKERKDSILRSRVLGNSMLESEEEGETTEKR